MSTKDATRGTETYIVLMEHGEEKTRGMERKKTLNGVTCDKILPYFPYGTTAHI
jgi:hypothetical protein